MLLMKRRRRRRGLKAGEAEDGISNQFPSDSWNPGASRMIEAAMIEMLGQVLFYGGNPRVELSVARFN